VVAGGVHVTSFRGWGVCVILPLGWCCGGERRWRVLVGVVFVVKPVARSLATGLVVLCCEFCGGG
ncbi:hypothetical protein, partial [Dermatophilus congolensis]